MDKNNEDENKEEENKVDKDNIKRNKNNIMKYNNNKELNKEQFLLPQIYKSFCFFTKMRIKPKEKKQFLNNYNIKKKDISENNNYQNIGKYKNLDNKNNLERNKKIENKKDENDKINYKKPKTGLIISKLRLKDDIKNIKLIQDEVKN